MWNISTRKAVCAWNAHSGFTRGVSFGWEGDRLYSCGSDKTGLLVELNIDIKLNCGNSLIQTLTRTQKKAKSPWQLG